MAFEEELQQLWHKNPVVVIGVVGGVGLAAFVLLRKGGSGSPQAPAMDNTPVNYSIYPSTGGVSGGGGVPTPMPVPVPVPTPSPNPNPSPCPPGQHWVVGGLVPGGHCVPDQPPPCPGCGPSPSPHGPGEYPNCNPGYYACTHSRSCIPLNQYCEGAAPPPSPGPTPVDDFANISMAHSLF